MKMDYQKNKKKREVPIEKDRIEKTLWGIEKKKTEPEKKYGVVIWKKSENHFVPQYLYIRSNSSEKKVFFYKLQSLVTAMQILVAESDCCWQLVDMVWYSGLIVWLSLFWWGVITLYSVLLYWFFVG